MTQEQYEELVRRLADNILFWKLKIQDAIRDTRGLYEGTESIDLMRGRVQGLESALRSLQLMVEDEESLWH